MNLELAIKDRTTLAKDVVMPALGMAQETGTLLQWLKAPGEAVAKGEPLMEVETDKATVEVEAPASGVLAQVTARPGDVIPVGQTIALIVGADEVAPTTKASSATATPVAARIAAEHNVDLAQVKPQGGRVQKEDVLAYLAAHQKSPGNGRSLASPKARRLAQERGLNLKDIPGSGPDGAVLAADVDAALTQTAAALTQTAAAPATAVVTPTAPAPAETSAAEALTVSRMWRVMAERVTQAWTTIPHFYLLREVNATHLIAWRDDARQRLADVTYTDLLVKLVAAALRAHPRLNAAWNAGGIILNSEINLGLAVAVAEGLVVPVIHRADQLKLAQLAAQRTALVARAQANKLSPDDLSGGTFTLSNLGMYGVEAFNAIVNPPQAAILAVGGIADRVVPVNGQPAVQPRLTLSLSCDHRVVDGARGAQFLQTLAALIEHPLQLLD